MQKVYGSPKRQDGVYKVGRNTYELIYGFGKDNDDDATGWNWRTRFNHRPTRDEIKSAIETLINTNTAQTILTGFSWNGKPVWLSAENQQNFQRAVTTATLSDGANLPVKFKLGEDENGEPVYHTFTKIEPLTDFFNRMGEFIDSTLKSGYNEKDGVDYTLFDNVQ